MKQQILIIFLILTVFTGCDSSDDDTHEADAIVKNLQTEDADIGKAQATFNDIYQKALIQVKDSLTRQKIKGLHMCIAETNKYIDSLKSEMSKLDNDDTKTVEFVKDIFLNKGTGDHLFAKLKHAFTLAQNLAITEVMKSVIKDSRSGMLGEPNIEERKKQYFGSNSPLGIILTLDGFESELFKVGAESLQGYTNIER